VPSCPTAGMAGCCTTPTGEFCDYGALDPASVAQDQFGCLSIGGQWTGSSATDAGSDSGGDAGVCTPNTFRCSGPADLEVCNSTGTAWIAQGTCASSVCWNGRCVTCAPGALGCSGQQPQQCNGSGTAWQNLGPACSGATPACSNGACSVCVAGALGCNGSQPQRCNTTGTACQDVGSVCAGITSTCLDGLCASTTGTSCQAGGAGMTTCGAGGSGSESCCASLEVPGGTFDRAYDSFVDAGVTIAADGGPPGEAAPASVSAFRLDRNLVTVGRFRQFVSAVVGGWLPAPGEGKHTHLNGGFGLVNVGAPPDAGPVYETGWDATWNANLATTVSGWNSNLIQGVNATWTKTVGSNENLPITLADWWESYAFCIWDGGFLPSHAELEFAAAGGSEQRQYPWSPPYPGATSVSCSNANYTGCLMGAAANAVGSESPAGDGKWGQSDLAGNVWEWTLDWNYSGGLTVCVNCANLAPAAASAGVVRGGSFLYSASDLIGQFVQDAPKNYRAPGDAGFRCARTP
jgi:sulfatase modifying factor 1